MNDNVMDLVEREVLGWPGVDKGTGRFDSVVYTVGRREIGHVHRDGIADLPFPKGEHDELIAAGKASPHRAGIAGFISVPVRSRDAAVAAVALFRRNYERPWPPPSGAAREAATAGGSIAPPPHSICGRDVDTIP